MEGKVNRNLVCFQEKDEMLDPLGQFVTGDKEEKKARVKIQRLSVRTTQRVM